MTLPPLPPEDLAVILTATAPLWPEMRGERLFLTGGTGFFGTWLTESFLHANRELSLNAHLTLLTRRPAEFRTRSPHLAHDAALTLLAGDVRDFAFPAEPHTFILHAATEASARQLADEPHEMLTTILAGTARVLSFAAATDARKLLLTSSGAVYGPQPPSLSHIPEDYPGAPDPLLPSNVYAEGKRASELMCSLAAGPRLEIKIARCFAFLGPHLPLHTHFAAGNFLADAMAGRSIRIASDGRTLRSYLYAADLTAWLWTMLFRAPSMRAFNVGSEDPVSIRELAENVAATVTPASSVIVAGVPGQAPAARYVPSTARARAELGLRQTVSLADAIRRTAAWHRLKSDVHTTGDL